MKRASRKLPRRQTTGETAIPAIQGNLQGLKPSQISSLERLYKRRLPRDAVYSLEQAREIALLSRAINRQIGLLVDRAGKPQMVIAGTATSIYIPELPPVRSGRLRGLRLLHTHLAPDGLSEEDLLDMLFLRLDNAVALTVNENGEPVQWQGAWLLPAAPPDSLLDIAGEATRHSSYISRQMPWHHNQCAHLAIANDMDHALGHAATHTGPGNAAILISVSNEPAAIQERNLEELAELCRSAGLQPEGRLIQRSRHQEARLLGKGKFAELEVMALTANADILVFDGELTPAQLRNIADLTERKVMDRTQLILDIFAQNATTRAGKLQVELAQLAYSMPRLAGGRKALDRLAGGIGGRGPGETLLESDRRKVRARMASLKAELTRLKRQRAIARNRRERASIPVAALVGYTNAGKSTLLNALTASDTLAANRLFATLDPVTRRLRFPREREITLADTVGFIRNLPKELTEAFSATLEELHRADILIHVADASQPELEKQLAAVEITLEDLGLAEKPRLLVLNKCDTADSAIELANAYPEAIFISALRKEGFEKLLGAIEDKLFTGKEATRENSGIADRAIE